MSHTVTAKLNSAARQHQNQAGTTFFVSLGENNYDHKTKQNVWTNYDAALFAKDGQVEFYTNSLVENAIISVSGTGIILDASNPEYKPKLVIQDAKLGFFHSPNSQPNQPQPQKNFQQAQQGFAQQQAPQQQPQGPNTQGYYQQDNTPPF